MTSTRPCPLWTPLLLALAIVPLAACGGSGGGSGTLGSGGGLPGSGFLRHVSGVGTDVGNAVATYSDGSFVVAGDISGTSVFGPGDPAETTLTVAGVIDMFVARYNADGTLAWAHNAGGADRTYGLGIDTFPDGSCVVVGSFSDTATFGAGTATETTLSDVDMQGDIYVARYGADGSLTWVKRAGRNFTDWAQGVTALADGSCVVTGYYDTIATFGPGEAGQIVLSNAGAGREIFVARYNADGTLAWVRSAGGTGTDQGLDITGLADGSVVVTGYIGFTPATFGLGEANQTTLTGAGIFDVFVARLDPTGDLVWARRAGGLSFDEAIGIDTFPDESFVVTGFFRGVSTFGPGEPGETVLTSFNGNNDIFVARYHANGDLNWAQQAGGTDHDAARRVAAHPDGSCVVTGAFAGIALWAPFRSDQQVHLATGDLDGFVARYAANGQLLWVRSGGGSSGSDRVMDASVRPNGSIVFCGRFVDACTFNESEPIPKTLLSGGGIDILFGVYTGDGSF